MKRIVMRAAYGAVLVAFGAASIGAAGSAGASAAAASQLVAVVATFPPSSGGDANGVPARSAPASNAPYTPSPLNGGQPTPYPLATLAPLDGKTTLPYPAYGTPVPGVGVGSPAPDVPALITLPQAILVAFARSPLLTTARADVVVQAAAVRLERAGLLPQISAGASLTQSYSQSGAGYSTTTTTTTTGATGTTGTTVTTGGPVTVTSAGFDATLSQLVFDGGRIAAAVAAARSGEANASENYEREMQTVAYDVATAYYNYLSAERTTQVDLQTVRQDLVQEDLVRAQIAAGTEARSDLATVQLPTAQARLAVVQAQGAELAAEAAFANSMGLDANVRAQPVDDAPVFTNTPTSTIPVPSYQIAVARALALRPDYDAYVQTVAQARSNIRYAELARFPTITGSASASDDSTGRDLDAFRNAHDLGLSLSVPIYDGGAISANVESARANLTIAVANQQNTALGVQLNVKQTLTGLVSAQAALVQAQQEYATALVNVQATQAQYRAGVTTLPLLLNAQVQLTTAEAARVTTVYSLRLAEQNYLYAVGSNFDPTGGGRSMAQTSATPSPAPSSGSGGARKGGAKRNR